MSVRTYTYDSWGNVIKESDESNQSNILSTTYTYNNWGSLVETVNPDGTYTSTTTEWDDSFPNCVYKNITTATAQAPITTLYDSEGREVKSYTTGLDGVNVEKYTRYNSLGKAELIENKIGKLTTTQNTKYDKFGRIVYSKGADESETYCSYNDRTVRTEAPTGTTTKTYDALGNIQSVIDGADTYLVYRYSSNGKPLSITTNTNSGENSSVMFEYDAAGNRTMMKDPDAGTTTTSYAADGTILSQTDAKGVTNSFTYDNLGRTKKITYSNESGKTITQYNYYGNSGYGKNRIIEKNVAGNSVKYTYNPHGKILTETRSVVQKAGTKTYTKSYTYNTAGQITSVTYPGNMTFNYIYDDDCGYLKEIKFKDRKTLYKLNSFDGLTLSTNTIAGELSKTVDSSGHPSQYILRSPKRIKDKQTFTFHNPTGNLTSRIWIHDGRTVVNESFEYDNLDRLLRVKYYNGTTAMLMSYQDNGNILLKTGVGAYKYDEEKVHAVTEVANSSKFINSNTVSTEFSLNGKIGKISDDKGCYMSYTYGPDDEKWISRLCDPSQVTTNDIEHIYFGDYDIIIYCCPIKPLPACA